MSIKLMSKVWDMNESKFPSKASTLKYVLIALADNASDEGYCFPSISTICRKTLFKKRAVINALNLLEQLGFIQKANRFDKKTGRATSNEYWLRIPDPVHEVHGGGALNAPGRVHEVHTLNHHIEPSINHFKKATEVAPTSEMNEIFNYWKNKVDGIMNISKIKFTPSRHKALKNVLYVQKRTIEDVKLAIDGCLSRSFNRDNKQVDLPLICRETKIDGYISSATNPNIAKVKPKNGSDAMLQAFREMNEETETDFFNLNTRKIGNE